MVYLFQQQILSQLASISDHIPQSPNKKVNTSKTALFDGLSCQTLIVSNSNEYQVQKPPASKYYFYGRLKTTRSNGIFKNYPFRIGDIENIFHLHNSQSYHYRIIAYFYNWAIIYITV